MHICRAYCYDRMMHIIMFVFCRLSCMLCLLRVLNVLLCLLSLFLSSVPSLIGRSKTQKLQVQVMQPYTSHTNNRTTIIQQLTRIIRKTYSDQTQHTQIVHTSYTIVQKPYQNHTHIVHKSYDKTYNNHRQILHKSYTNRTQTFTNQKQIIQQSYKHRTQIIHKSYTKHTQTYTTIHK